MSQTQRPRSRQYVAALPSADRAWLEERIREYRELLDYLRDH